MSDFWTSDLGEITGNAADAFSKFKTKIPDGTSAVARIEEFTSTEYKGEKFLKIEWVLMDGEFKGASVDQKLRVFGDSSSNDSAKKRHRALNMLKLIYQLYNTKPTHSGEPTHQDLSVFVGKMAGIRIRQTEPNDHGDQFNWVSEIHDAKGFKCETGTTIVAKQTTNSYGQGPVDSAFSRQGQLPTNTSLDDDIPF